MLEDVSHLDVPRPLVCDREVRVVPSSRRCCEDYTGFAASAPQSEGLQLLETYSVFGGAHPLVPGSHAHIDFSPFDFLKTTPIFPDPHVCLIGFTVSLKESGELLLHFSRSTLSQLKIRCTSF